MQVIDSVVLVKKILFDKSSKIDYLDQYHFYEQFIKIVFKQRTWCI